MTAMKQLLEYLVRGLSDHPDDVSVEVQEDESTVSSTVHAHATDIGRVIGKKGKTINAIRALAKILTIKSGKRFLLTIP